jgi:drug/metabolite transporter (DMT)-like permease
VSAGGRRRRRVSLLAYTAWQMLLGALAVSIIALLVPSRPIAWTPAFTAGLAYSVALASSVAWLLWILVVQRLPATVAGLSSWHRRWIAGQGVAEDIPT